MKLTKKLGILVAILVVLQMVFCFPIAAADSPAVATNPSEALKAVIKVNLIYTDETSEEHLLKSESGFFIDSNYILTCYHGISLDYDEIQTLSDFFGSYFAKNYKKQLSYEIVLSRTAKVKATLTEASSEESDYAVLKLAKSVQVDCVLKLGKDADVTLTQKVHCLGFPSIVSGWDASTDNTSDDVSATDGTVEKLTTLNGVPVIQHGAKGGNGSSGGPLVDDNGVVIGITNGVLTTGSSTSDADFYYALRIGQVEDNLYKFNIPYQGGSKGADSSEGTTAADTPAAATPEATTECAHDWVAGEVVKCAQTYTCSICGETKQDEPVHQFGEWVVVTKATKKEAGLQERTCSVCGEKETQEIPVSASTGLDMTKIIIIVCIAVVVIILIVIIAVVAGGKKKNNLAPAPEPIRTAPPAPNGNPPMPPRPPVPPTFDPGAGATTVLNEGAGETTVLGGGATASSCALIRKKNGERIAISGADFIIGKERRRVNYCISDNSSISRSHARIVTRGNSHYIVDMNSTNFTFVNGNKVPAGQEQLLNDGDKIRLSDEEFEFRA